MSNYRNGEDKKSFSIVKRGQLIVLVKLKCGCTVKTRNRPLSGRAKYPCPSGMGHGYNVSWVSFDEGDFHAENDIK